MKTIHSIVAALAVLAILLGIGLLPACSGGGEGSSATPTPILTPVPTLTPRPATAQEIELIHNTITTTRQLKTVHTTFEMSGQSLPSTKLQADVDRVAGSSYLRGELRGKHVERLYLNDVSYKKDTWGQWVEFTGMDEDLSGLQEIMSIGGNPVAFIQNNEVTNTQAPEMMDGVQVERFTSSSGDTKLDVWVDAKTGYDHKHSLCSTSSVSEGESCMVWTQSKQNEPLNVVKLAGGVIPTPVPPTPTAVPMWNTEQATFPRCGEWRYMLGGNWWSMLGEPSDSTVHGIAGAAVGGQEVWAAISQSRSASLLRWNNDGWGDLMAVHDKGQLNSLASISAHNMWAVGYTEDENLDRHSLTAHWDGKEWQVVPSPDISRSTNLGDVFGFSSDDVWAIGSSSTGVDISTLMMHWNGNAWSIVPSPNPGSFQGDPFTSLQAIAGATSSDMWAVGFYMDPDQNRVALTMHWDGKAWQVIPNSVLAELTDVAAVSSKDAWAVGSHYDPNAQSVEGIIIHWDGTSWRKVALPTGESIPMVNMVAALSAKDVWAAGGPGEGNPGPGVLLHWDGQTWSNVPVPGSEPIRFEAIVPLGPGRIWLGGTVNQSSRAFVTLFTEGQCSGR